MSRCSVAPLAVPARTEPPCSVCLTLPDESPRGGFTCLLPAGGFLELISPRSKIELRSAPLDHLIGGRCLAAACPSCRSRLGGGTEKLRQRPAPCPQSRHFASVCLAKLPFCYLSGSLGQLSRSSAVDKDQGGEKIYPGFALFLHRWFLSQKPGCSWTPNSHKILATSVSGEGFWEFGVQERLSTLCLNRGRACCVNAWKRREQLLGVGNPTTSKG